MESLSFFKFFPGLNRSRTTTIIEDDANDFDDGPFFDLHFPSPNIQPNQDNDEVIIDNDSEFNLTLSLSPDDAVISDIVVTTSSDDGEEDEANNSKTDQQQQQQQLLVSLLKRATKYNNVFMLSLRKPKLSSDASEAPKQSFFVKLKKDGAPVVSLFTRDASSRSSSSGDGAANAKQADDGAEDKNGAKEMVMKYLEKVKPFYVRVSKNKKLKMKLGELLRSAKDEAVAVEEKRLGKSKSTTTKAMFEVAKRREEVAVEDGIESAIAHCKRSFTAGVDGKV